MTVAEAVAPMTTTVGGGDGDGARSAPISLAIPLTNFLRSTKGSSMDAGYSPLIL